VTTESDAISVTAPNGVVWTRCPGGTSTGQQLLRALELLVMDHAERDWNLWQEGRSAQEHHRVMQVLCEWDRPRSATARRRTVDEDVADWEAKYDMKEAEEKQRLADLVAERYDKNREHQRLMLLRTESDAAFFAHVLEKPASPAQPEDAERRLAESRATATGLRQELGDPEQVIDEQGQFPEERRKWHRGEHMTFFRHRLLREWESKDRRRFKALLAMPIPDVSAMCSECQAPTQWHEYDISLRLFQPPPSPGTQAETLARLMPGWWERCPACTAYRIGHVWGGAHALPDFTGEQWIAMLPPLLRTLFVAPEPKKPNRTTAGASPDALKRRLLKLEAEATKLRAQLDAAEKPPPRV
jgi:hypothetical protein